LDLFPKKRRNSTPLYSCFDADQLAATRQADPVRGNSCVKSKRELKRKVKSPSLLLGTRVADESYVEVLESRRFAWIGRVLKETGNR
jgi:hypothetical protein